MGNIRSWLGVLVVAGVLISTLVPALTVQAQSAFAHGTVVALQGTPHLWFADEQGVLHWGGDTRALAGKHVRWDSRTEVTLTQLLELNRGDPWLSAGLLKDGAPIYLVKWETDWSEPRLLHIQSIGDVELFGINGSNYGNFVLGKSTWEARYGISTAGLQRSKLAPTVIDLAGTGPATRQVELTEGLWTVNASVNGNRNCSSGTCIPSKFIVFVESMADGTHYTFFAFIELAADWSGSTPLRIGPQSEGFISLDPDKPTVNVVVLAADAAQWTITLRKQ